MRIVADLAPESIERLARALCPAGGVALRQHHGVQGAGTGAAEPFDDDALILEQPVEHAPGERAMRAAALQREIDAARAGTGGHTATPFRVSD